MKANDWLTQAEQQLTNAGIATARLDALVLLEDCLGHDRAYLLAHPETLINADQQTLLAGHLERRTQHEPLAFIRNKTEFYGREFYVDQRVLEPRPESETMIDLLSQLAAPNDQIADIGTGSGALAITAQIELPASDVAATDIDPNCLTVAQKNAATHGVNLSFFPGDLLTPFLQKSCNFVPTVLLCNLPYVPDNFQINLAANHEPRTALFGGPDGLDLYRTLFAQTKQLPTQPTMILTESLPPQHSALTDIAAAQGYKLAKEEDFIQVFSKAH